MSTSALARKLQIKPGQTVFSLFAPDSYLAALAPLPAGATLVAEGPADVVHLFVASRAELEARAPAALAALKPDGAFWASYPKGGSGIPTDLNRDEGWAILTGRGWQGVRQVAVDATWSAVRFKQVEKQDEADPAAAHFRGDKAGLRPIYDRIAAEIAALGSDVELGVRQSYIAFRRNQQFAVVKVAGRPPRLELGLRLPGHPGDPRLVAPGRSFGAESATHKVILEKVDDVDAVVARWLAEAYGAG